MDVNLTKDENREGLQRERKLRRQAKNKLKKEDDKRGREEELRRKLCEPKDQRVRLVNQKELILMKGQHYSGSRTTSACFVPTSEEFPSLGKVTKDRRQKIVGLVRPSPIEPSSQERSTLSSTRPRPNETELVCPEPLTHCEEIREPLQPPTVSNIQKATVLARDLIKNQHSKPKRNDPIQIDVITALKKSENAAVPERKTVSRKELPSRLAGNQLDSSKPERKKGKVREIPKEKKPTHLKRVIMKEREDKRLAKENGASADLIAKETDSGFERKLSKSESAVGISTHLELGENVEQIPCKLTVARDQVEQLDVSYTSKQILCPIVDCATVNETSHLNVDIIGAREDAVIDEVRDSSHLVNSGKMSLHSRKFREYCDHSLSQELDTVVSALVRDIVKFQDRLYFSDPIKAHAKRRFVLGFREIKKYLSFKKIKLLIIAPDLERIKSTGGIDEIIETLKVEASAQEVPYVFAVGRRGLKKLTNKSHNVQGVSCIGVLSYEGSEVNFHAMQAILPTLREQYADKLEKAESCFKEVQQAKSDVTETNNVLVDLHIEETASEEPVDVNSEVISSFLSKLVKELGKD